MPETSYASCGDLSVAYQVIGQGSGKPALRDDAEKLRIDIHTARGFVVGSGTWFGDRGTVELHGTPWVLRGVARLAPPTGRGRIDT